MATGDARRPTTHVVLSARRRAVGTCLFFVNKRATLRRHWGIWDGRRAVVRRTTMKTYVHHSHAIRQPTQPRRLRFAFAIFSNDNRSLTAHTTLLGAFTIALCSSVYNNNNK